MQRIVFESISPFFQVGNIDQALDFYCQCLGFEPGWTWGEPPTQANICRNEISISLSQQDSPALNASGNVYIQVVNIDHYHAELLGRNVDVGPLADRDYGMRDFAVSDPWGNRLVFGEPMQE